MYNINLVVPKGDVASHQLHDSLGWEGHVVGLHLSALDTNPGSLNAPPFHSRHTLAPGTGSLQGTCWVLSAAPQ